MSLIPEPGASISILPAAIVFYSAVLVAFAVVGSIAVRVARRRRS